MLLRSMTRKIELQLRRPERTISWRRRRRQYGDRSLRRPCARTIPRNSILRTSRAGQNRAMGPMSVARAVGSDMSASRSSYPSHRSRRVSDAIDPARGDRITFAPTGAPAKAPVITLVGFVSGGLPGGPHCLEYRPRLARLTGNHHTRDVYVLKQLLRSNHRRRPIQRMGLPFMYDSEFAPASTRCNAL